MLTTILPPWHRLLRPVLSGLAALAALLTLSAADAVKMNFDLPAGPAGETLKSFARQAGREIVFAPQVVEAVNTQPVRGELEPKDALDQMLADTGLAATQDARTGAFAVRKETPVESKNGSSRLASDRAANDEGHSVIKLDTFEVMGRKSLNMDRPRFRDDAQPYVIFNRGTIHESGATDLEAFLKQRLTSAVSHGSNSQRPTNLGNTSFLNLRGLGLNQTLILVDGRRLANVTTSQGVPVQPDLNSIPLAAVERVEILPVTASGIYGGSATGGVINVVMRRDYHGTEINLRYDNTFESDSSQRRFDLSTGRTFLDGRLSVMISAGLSDSNHLASGDRDFVRLGREAILANNPAALLGTAAPPLGATTNIRASGGVQLTLKNTNQPLNSAFAHVPVGYGGRANDDGVAFLATAGRYNLELPDTAQLGGNRRSLTNATDRWSLAGSARFEISPRLESFAEAASSSSDSTFVSGLNVASFTIPASAPNNPFNQSIVVSTPLFGTQESFQTTARAHRIAGGLIAKLGTDWKAGVDFTWSSTTFGATGPTVRLQPSATVGITNGSIDILRDTTGSNFAPLLDIPSRFGPMTTVLRDYALRTSGPVLELPAGKVRINALLERREENLDETGQVTATSRSLVPAREQSVSSAAAELSLPVFGGTHVRTGLSELEFQISGRYDDYETIGTGSINLAAPTPITRRTNHVSSTDMTVGLRWTPWKPIMVRGSFGTGFLPPHVGQLAPNPSFSFPGALVGLTDPLRNNEPLGTILFTTGGNPDLRPEKSKSWSVGIVLQSSQVPEFRLSVDWVRIDKSDNISSIGASQDLLNAFNAILPSRISRAASIDGFPVGPITAIDFSDVNLSSATVEACDFSLDYALTEQSWGKLSLSANATRNLRSTSQIAATTPLVENLGAANFITGVATLKWRGNATIAWKKGSWAAGWTTSWSSPYFLNTAHSVVANQGGASVPSQRYHDVFVKYRVSSDIRGFRGLFGGCELQVGVRNLFGDEPPFDSSNADYFYSPQGDPRLTSYHVSLRRVF